MYLRLIGVKKYGDLVSDGILKVKIKEACYRKLDADEELNNFCAKSLHSLDYFKAVILVLYSCKNGMVEANKCCLNITMIFKIVGNVSCCGSVLAYWLLNQNHRSILPKLQK